MADNPAVTDLLNTLGTDPVSEEISGLIGSPPPYIPPPADEPRRNNGFGRRDLALASDDRPMNKTEEKSFLSDARSANTPTAGYKKFGYTKTYGSTN